MKIPEFSLSKPVSVDGRNLKDFFYLACGEEERLKFKDGEDMADYINLQKKKQTDEAADDNSKDDAKIVMAESQSVEERWNEIDDLCRVNCSISYCGFNPPPPHRRLLGDLAYLEVQFPADDEKVYVTAIPAGFYINTSTIETFNPAPASQACFSHELLDCLLQKSNSLRYAWVSLYLIR
jgi:protein TIF31